VFAPADASPRAPEIVSDLPPSIGYPFPIKFVAISGRNKASTNLAIQ